MVISPKRDTTSESFLGWEWPFLAVMAFSEWTQPWNHGKSRMLRLP